MPCRDFFDDHPEAYFREITAPALKKQISFAESALCAVLDALERANRYSSNPLPSVMTWINFEEAGITEEELLKWRKTHKELDAKYRAQEQERLKASAKAKLTSEELKALGLK